MKTTIAMLTQRTMRRESSSPGPRNGQARRNINPAAARPVVIPELRNNTGKNF